MNHDWRDRKPGVRAVHHVQLVARILHIQLENRCVYGLTAGPFTNLALTCQGKIGGMAAAAVFSSLT